VQRQAVHSNHLQPQHTESRCPTDHGATRMMPTGWTRKTTNVQGGSRQQAQPASCASTIKSRTIPIILAEGVASGISTSDSENATFIAAQGTIPKTTLGRASVSALSVETIGHGDKVVEPELGWIVR
jgi:hypothetical protein